jgi:hypothetical protein
MPCVERQRFGYGLDPDSNEKVDTDPGRPKLLTKKGKNDEISCLKSSLLGWRLLKPEYAFLKGRNI